MRDYGFIKSPADSNNGFLSDESNVFSMADFLDNYFTDTSANIFSDTANNLFGLMASEDDGLATAFIDGQEYRFKDDSANVFLLHDKAVKENNVFVSTVTHAWSMHNNYAWGYYYLDLFYFTSPICMFLNDIMFQLNNNFKNDLSFQSEFSLALDMGGYTVDYEFINLLEFKQSYDIALSILESVRLDVDLMLHLTTDLDADFVFRQTIEGQPLFQQDFDLINNILGSSVYFVGDYFYDESHGV